MKSDKLPYVIAGSAIGGIAAFFLLTDSGRKIASSVRNMDSNTIPDKMEKFRLDVERRAQTVSSKLESLRQKFNGSVETGRRIYDESGEEFQVKLRRMEDYNGRCVAGIHKSVDEMNRTLYSFEKTLMRPFAQIFALAQAVQGGVRKMRSEPLRKIEVKDNLNSMFDREHVSHY